MRRVKGAVPKYGPVAGNAARDFVVADIGDERCTEVRVPAPRPGDRQCRQCRKMVLDAYVTDIYIWLCRRRRPRRSPRLFPVVGPLDVLVKRLLVHVVDEPLLAPAVLGVIADIGKPFLL